MPRPARASVPPSNETLQALDPLMASLAYEPRDRALLLRALTHRSFANERPDLAPEHNETLEFLGDSVVGLAAAKLLSERFPEAREGELTRRRADLVCERSLALIAEALELGALLRLGRGEEQSGGRKKARLLASALEAVFGALLVDAGVERALEIASALLEPHLDAMRPGEADYKTRVQELLQGQGRGTPRYTLLGREGPDHAGTFFVALEVGGEELGRGDGRSKLEAEQAAACVAYGRLTLERAP